MFREPLNVSSSAHPLLQQSGPVGATGSKFTIVNSRATAMRAAAPRLAALAASAWGLPAAVSAADSPDPHEAPSASMPPLPHPHADRLRAKLPRLPGSSEPSSRGHSRSRSPSPPSPASLDSLDDMVPITFELLQEHYKQFPDPHISEDVRIQRGELARLHTALLAGEAEARDVVDGILAEKLPHGLDSTMYKARCACEEAAGRVLGVSELVGFARRLRACADRFAHFQRSQTEHVQSVIDQFLPQDFRGSLFTAYKHRSEKMNAQAVEDLVANGGSIRDKYNLLWEQQWKRRENLAMIGNATGIWKWLVRYLAGVPQPLLTFAKNINAPHGPTEALRAKFGAALKELSMFAIELNALCTAAALAQRTDKQAEVKAQVARSLALYEAEVDKFVELLEDVIVNSPFFIKPEQIQAFKPATA